MLIPNVDVKEFERFGFKPCRGNPKIHSVIICVLPEVVNSYLSVLSALIYRIGKKMIQGYIKSQIVDTETIVQPQIFYTI